jgi:hypothetical protein
VFDYQKNIGRLDDVADEMKRLTEEVRTKQMNVDTADVIVKAQHTIVQAVKTQVQAAAFVSSIPKDPALPAPQKAA